MKYSLQKAKAVAAMVESGLSLSRAAVVLGMNKDTALDWRRRYSQFGELIEAPEGRFIHRMVCEIALQAKTDWRAAMELLARRFPSEFAKDRTEPEEKPKSEGQPLTLAQLMSRPIFRETLRQQAEMAERINEAERQGRKWRIEGMSLIVD